MSIALPGLGSARPSFSGRVGGELCKGNAIMMPLDGKAFELPWTEKCGGAQGR